MILIWKTLSTDNWILKNSLNSMGWRPRKHYFKVVQKLHACQKHGHLSKLESQASTSSYKENSIHADASYSAFRRISWCLSVSWIIIACHQNRGGIVKKFLSFSIWLPISKLSYCIYLLHLPIQLVLLSSLRQPQHFTDVRGVHKFFGDFGIIFAVAFVFALMFEYPTLRLMKVFLDSRNVVKQNGIVPKPISQS